MTATATCAGLTFANTLRTPVTIRLGTPRHLGRTVEVRGGGTLDVPGAGPETLWVAQSPDFVRAGIERAPADCATPATATTATPASPFRAVYGLLGATALGLGGLGVHAVRSRLRG
ncbi:hypothetical protein GCM10027418_20660 [Mariniluteicoccus endophyticus]